MLLSPHSIIDATKFTWFKNKGITEVSDIDYFKLQEIYNDASDIGLYVQGRREMRLFLLDSVDRDEGGILRWVLVTPDKKFEISIYND